MYSPLHIDWDQAIRDGAQRVSYVDLYYPNSAPVPTLAGIPIESFAINVDRDAEIRRSGTMTIISEPLLEELRRAPGVSPLEPYGSEFRIRHGVILPDGTEALVPLGIFQSETMTYDSTGAKMTFDLVDRSKVQQRKLYGFERDAGGRTAFSVLGSSYTDMAPDSQVIYGTGVTDLVIPGGTKHKGNLLTIKHDTAASLGADYYFDVDGDIRIEMKPTLNTATFSGDPDWIVDCGAQGVMISADVSLSRKETYNRILVVGINPTEDSDAVYADIWDNDPRSPTYYGGPFGRVDKWIDDNKLTTYNQCVIRANHELNASKGLSKTLKLKSLGNAALDVGDILRVVFLDGSFEYHIIDSFSIDHTGQMSIQTRTEIL